MIQRDQPTIFDGGLLAAVSSTSDENLSLARGPAERVLPARQRWLESLGLTLDQLVVMDVTHPERWDDIYEVTDEDTGVGAREQKTALVTDALVTRQTGVVLFLLIADCQPTIIYDPVQCAVALVHLGRQSTEAQLAPKVVTFMTERYGSRPADLRVYIGPSIKPTSYVFSEFTQADQSHWQPYLHKHPDGIHIDISQFVCDQLLSAGVEPAHLQICPVDTVQSSDYFSHYRAARSGGTEPEARFATIACLR